MMHNDVARFHIPRQETVFGNTELVVKIRVQFQIFLDESRILARRYGAKQFFPFVGSNDIKKFAGGHGQRC